MKEFVSCCSNCEYYYSDSSGRVCNALHTPNVNEDIVFYCVDFECTSDEKRLRRDIELQKKVREDSRFVRNGEDHRSGEAFQEVSHRWMAIVNNCHTAVQNAILLERSSRTLDLVNEGDDLSAERVLDTISRQYDQIRCQLNIRPEYVLLSVNVRRLIDRYFYEQSYQRFISNAVSVHPLRSYFGLEPLTDSRLPNDFIQVVVPIR